MLRWILRKFEAWRTEDEDRKRALRIVREYGLTDDAVPEPTGRRIRPREGPTSDYTRTV